MKSLTFLSISEFRTPDSFVRRIDHKKEQIIQIAVSHRTIVASVLDVLEREMRGKEDNVLAYQRFINENDFKKKENFFEHYGFTPEPGYPLFAIFNLKSVEP